MKKFIYIIAILGLITFTQCNFNNLNVDPNRVTSDVVGVEYRLPAFQYLLVETMANNVVKRVGNTVGYTFYRQGPTGLNDYNYTPADGSNISLWEKLYLAMNSGNGLLERAELEKKIYYRGIAKILMAASLGLTSSIYGDIPYSQAFQPEKYIFPVFDSQDLIYTQIQKLLDDAIVDLNSSNGGKKPGTDDIIFNGDLSRWIKTAYGLKARFYLSTIKVNPESYTLANNALLNALASNDDNCILNFEIGQTGQQHPMYLERTTTRDTEVDPQFALLMRNSADPRTNFYAVVRSSLLTGTRAQYGPFYAMKDSYFPIITYEECLFMKAEIAMNTGGSSSAEPVLKEAIYNSLKRVCSKTVGSSDSSENNLVNALPDSILVNFKNIKGSLTGLSDSDSWKRIFEQKHIALFLQAESWNDYRRTEKYITGVAGLPQIPIRSGSTLPRRYQYSSREVSVRNQNIPPNYTIFDRFWWDAQ